MYEHLSIEHDEDGIARVTMNRPPANAVSDRLVAELDMAADELATSNARVVVLRSALDIFMAGADLKMVDEGWPTVDERIRRFQWAFSKWERLPCPTIAVLNGHTLGAGCELALSCDWRVMARGPGRIGLPEVLRGVLAAAGGTQRLTRLIGRAMAMDMAVRGRMIDADEALRIGLVTIACDAGELEVQAEALAAELAALPRQTVAAIKRCVNAHSEPLLDQGLAVEVREMLALRETADAREGVRSFVEKRSPVFVHR